MVSFKYVNIPLLDLDAPLPCDKLTETVVVVLGHMLRAETFVEVIFFIAVQRHP